jgi:hypothetical protein
LIESTYVDGPWFFFADNQRLRRALDDRLTKRPNLQVRILVGADDNVFLNGSVMRANHPVMQKQMHTIWEMLQEIKRRHGNVAIGRLRVSNMSVSILRFDNTMLVTPYLVGLTTDESPRFILRGSVTVLFKKYIEGV